MYFIHLSSFSKASLFFQTPQETFWGSVSSSRTVCGRQLTGQQCQMLENDAANVIKTSNLMPFKKQTNNILHIHLDILRPIPKFLNAFNYLNFFTFLLIAFAAQLYFLHDFFKVVQGNPSGNQVSQNCFIFSTSSTTSHDTLQETSAGKL